MSESSRLQYSRLRRQLKLLASCDLVKAENLLAGLAAFLLDFLMSPCMRVA